MSDWQPISTAPKDGSIIDVRRVDEGKVAFAGQASWRTVTFPALPPHPIGGDIYAPEETVTGWMCADVDKRFPEPTHWKPRGEVMATMPDTTEGKNLELIIKALSAALYDANIGMPEIVFRDRNDFKAFIRLSIDGFSITPAGAVMIDGIEITDIANRDRAK